MQLNSLSAAPVGGGALLLLLVVTLSTAANVSVVYLCLIERATVQRLLAFLAATALCVFAFSQAYTYNGLVGTSWDVSAAVALAERQFGGLSGVQDVTTTREAQVSDSIRHAKFIVSATQEQLYGIALLYRTRQDEGTRRAIREQALFLTSACEIKNFGTAIYFSGLTWASANFGDYEPAPWVRLLAALETLLGYVSMAFLVTILGCFVKTKPSAGAL
jgi:hypothetical protein